jgi:hypothetical protein
VQKESLLKRLLAKFKKKDKEVEEEQPVEKKEKQTEKKKKEKAPKEKKVKEKKKGKSKKQKEAAANDGQQILPEMAESDILDDTLNGSDAIILELEKEEVAKEEVKIKEKPKKKEKAKKDKTTKKDKKDSEASDGDEEKNKKPKKQKKKKEKKVKEKNIVLYDYGETPLTKKSVSFVFLVCLLLMLAVIALLVNYSGHANRRLAEEAFDEGDYLQCYQLLYGQHLNESQEVMFHQSKIHLKMDSLWNRYRSLAAEKQSAFKEVVKFILDGCHGLNPEISEQTINEAFDCVIYSEKATLYTQEMQKEERERDPLATISKMETVQEEGNRNIRRIVDFYSLDAIISVGYRVNCTKATNFRIWTT